MRERPCFDCLIIMSLLLSPLSGLYQIPALSLHNSIELCNILANIGADRIGQSDRTARQHGKAGKG